jgi:hypothetical protein
VSWEEVFGKIRGVDMMEKNTGEKRLTIAHERIYKLGLEAMGNSFLWAEMEQISIYALTGEYNSQATWKPSKEDLSEIDYGEPKTLPVILKEHTERQEKLYGGWRMGSAASTN